MLVSWTRCKVTVANVTKKDQGKWLFEVGTGNDLAKFKRLPYIYDVTVTGNKFSTNATFSFVYVYIPSKH